MDIGSLLGHLLAHQTAGQEMFHLTPSENVLSPFARLPFILDAYSRYFLDDLRLFGSWFFRGGRELGAIEQEVLAPVLREMAGAAHVNVRPVSGLNCMTVVMAALCDAGDTVLTVPLQAGGHASTSVVAKRLGVDVDSLPMAGPYDLDLDRLSTELRQRQPALIYFDQSTLLFPIDPWPVRELIERFSPRTRIHYDSSHTNGLILCGALFNPLERGASSFGGSTHKTLPGPHKGFFATNDAQLAAQVERMSDHFVSHHHMADVLSLAITLIELRDCGGERYAKLVMDNAKIFAATLRLRDVAVAAEERGFTGCHQVWATPPAGADIQELGERLGRSGFVVNTFNGLPGIDKPSFRLSLAESTRMGADTQQTIELAEVFCDASSKSSSEENCRARVKKLRTKLRSPQYCFAPHQLREMGLATELVDLLQSVEDWGGAPLRAVADRRA